MKTQRTLFSMSEMLHVCLCTLIIFRWYPADAEESAKGTEPSSESSVNLVKNPGFELNSGEGAKPSGWRLPPAAGTSFSLDLEVFHSGKASARITGNDPAKQTRYVQACRQRVGVPDGKPLWLSIWVKTDRVDRGRINVLHINKDGTVIRNQSIQEFNGTLDWKEIGGLIKPALGTVKLELVMGLVKSKGTVWFDDVRAEIQGTVKDAVGQFQMTSPRGGQAGMAIPARFEITMGKGGMTQGGKVTLRYDRWRPAREFRLRKVRGKVEGSDATFRAGIPPRKKTWPPVPQPAAVVLEMVNGETLPAGSKLVLDGELTWSKLSNVVVNLSAEISSFAGSASRPLEGKFRLQAVGGPPASLRCVAESRPLAEETGRVTVAVTDQYGNPAESFLGEVKFVADQKVKIPAAYTFTKVDRGSKDFDVRFPPNEVSRIVASSGKLATISNPVLPRQADEDGIYFGDIHVHCEISGDGVGDPDLAYDYGRRFMGLDFAALSDHSPRGRNWQRVRDVGKRHHSPGKFVTLLGFEWSDARNGHRNAYYPDFTGPEQPRLRDNMNSWWNFFDEKQIRVVTVPHHPNTASKAKRSDGKPVWGPMNWSVINKKYQRVVELCQNRGSFEAPGGPIKDLRISRQDQGSSVQAALALGHRIGFIGSTDTHIGRPGTGSARCVLLTRENSRIGLWEALHQRRCYATSGAHIILFFRVNGSEMGSEIKLGKKEVRQIEWRVIGTEQISRVDLLLNNETIKSWRGEGKDDVSGKFAHELPLNATEWWYVRVIQADSEMAWSSPVWVDAE